MQYLILAAVILAAVAICLHRNRKRPGVSAFLRGFAKGLIQTGASWYAVAKTLVLMLYRKGALVLAASLAGQTYMKQNGLPFAEILYLVNVVSAVFLVALVVRFLFFPEVAEFAEDGKRFDEALTIGKYPFAMRQYWFGTAISFAVPTLIAIAVF